MHVLRIRQAIYCCPINLKFNGQVVQRQLHEIKFMGKFYCY